MQKLSSYNGGSTKEDWKKFWELLLSFLRVVPPSAHWRLTAKITPLHPSSVVSSLPTKVPHLSTPHSPATSWWWSQLNDRVALSTLVLPTAPCWVCIPRLPSSFRSQSFDAEVQTFEQHFVQNSVRSCNKIWPEWRQVCWRHVESTTPCWWIQLKKGQGPCCTSQGIDWGDNHPMQCRSWWHSIQIVKQAWDVRLFCSSPASLLSMCPLKRTCFPCAPDLDIGHNLPWVCRASIWLQCTPNLAFNRAISLCMQQFERFAALLKQDQECTAFECKGGLHVQQCLSEWTTQILPEQVICRLFAPSHSDTTSNHPFSRTWCASVLLGHLGDCFLTLMRGHTVEVKAKEVLQSHCTLLCIQDHVVGQQDVIALSSTSSPQDNGIKRLCSWQSHSVFEKTRNDKVVLVLRQSRQTGTCVASMNHKMWLPSNVHQPFNFGAQHQQGKIGKKEDRIHFMIDDSGMSHRIEQLNKIRSDSAVAHVPTDQETVL